MRRGFTLIELMICVAILGIMTGLSGGMLWQQRQALLRETQRERAWQALDYAATRATRGEPLDGPTVEALLQELPRSKLASHDGKLLIHWVEAGGHTKVLTLSVFPGASR